MILESNNLKYVIGIDEVGRGPLAGPVAVGVCVVPKEMTRKQLLTYTKIIKLKDSKKLSEKMREMWHAKMLEMQSCGKLDFAVTLISNKIIDKQGLTFAIKKAMSDSLKKVQQTNCFKLDKPTECLVLLDGGLRAPVEFTSQKTIIKGDEKIFTISLASIAAKVTRDAHMKKISLKYPTYGFELHKGYGTKQHVAAIKKDGVTPIHRKSFLRNILKVD